MSALIYTLVFAQVQEEIRGVAARAAHPRGPSVPQDLYVAFGRTGTIHHDVTGRFARANTRTRQNTKMVFFFPFFSIGFVFFFYLRDVRERTELRARPRERRAFTAIATEKYQNGFARSAQR